MPTRHTEARVVDEGVPLAPLDQAAQPHACSNCGAVCVACKPCPDGWAGCRCAEPIPPATVPQHAAPNVDTRPDVVKRARRILEAHTPKVVQGTIEQTICRGCSGFHSDHWVAYPCAAAGLAMLLVQA
jgi:hypothetical protein